MVPPDDSRTRPSRISSPGQPFAPGQIVTDKYELLERIGKGGMGVVFAARHLTLGRKVALKFVRVDCADDATYSKRLRREARIAGALTHENVAQILDLGESDGQPFVVLEFVEGRTIKDLLADEGPPGVSRSVSLVRQICRGVQAAHDLGIVHRDLKPANVMLRRDGTVKVLDFGLAKFERSPLDMEVTATATAGVGGTPHYMAPEVARGESTGDARADVYAVGVVLYELLSGRRPHEGDSPNAVLYSVTTQRPPSLGKVKSDLPPALVAVVDAAIESDPKRRTASINDLLESLAPWDESSPSSASSVEPAPSSPGASSRPYRALAVTVATALLAAGYLLGRTHAGVSEPTPLDVTRAVDAELEPPQGVQKSSIPPPAEVPEPKSHEASTSTRPPPADAPDPKGEPNDMPSVSPASPTRPATGKKPKATAKRSPSASAPSRPGSDSAAAASTAAAPASRPPGPAASTAPDPPRPALGAAIGFESENPY